MSVKWKFYFSLSTNTQQVSPSPAPLWVRESEGQTAGLLPLSIQQGARQDHRSFPSSLTRTCPIHFCTMSSLFFKVNLLFVF